MSFKTIADVRRANREAGQHFFDRDTMHFFSSRVVSSLYAGRYFITAESYPETGRTTYAVREVREDGFIKVDISSMRHMDIEDAREAARNLGREVRK